MNYKLINYWFIVFVIYFILIVKFNNSLYRTAYVISLKMRKKKVILIWKLQKIQLKKVK